jgi:hypothetical protein
LIKTTKWLLAPNKENIMTSQLQGIGNAISHAFLNGELEISRPNSPSAGWSGLPEVYVTDELKSLGATSCEIRLFLTFTAALDRAREADSLWRSAGNLFKLNKSYFVPTYVLQLSDDTLLNTLKEFRVSQRHGPDSSAWKAIATALSDQTESCDVLRAINEGRGDATALLHNVGRKKGAKQLFPFLAGPKIGPMWVRMLVYPGEAEVSKLIQLPVSVDVQVRKVSEYFGVTNTAERSFSPSVRRLIQDAWSSDVLSKGSSGPGILANTCCALDPALWYWGKWGCTHCERNKRKIPIHALCNKCIFSPRISEQLKENKTRC